MSGKSLFDLSCVACFLHRLWNWDVCDLGLWLRGGFDGLTGVNEVRFGDMSGLDCQKASLDACENEHDLTGRVYNYCRSMNTDLGVGNDKPLSFALKGELETAFGGSHTLREVIITFELDGIKAFGNLDANLAVEMEKICMLMKPELRSFLLDRLYVTSFTMEYRNGDYSFEDPTDTSDVSEMVNMLITRLIPSLKTSIGNALLGALEPALEGILGPFILPFYVPEGVCSPSWEDFGSTRTRALSTRPVSLAPSVALPNKDGITDLEPASMEKIVRQFEKMAHHLHDKQEV